MACFLLFVLRMKYNCARVVSNLIWLGGVACGQEMSTSTTQVELPMVVSGIEARGMQQAGVGGTPQSPVPQRLPGCDAQAYGRGCYEEGMVCPAADLSFGLVCKQSDQGGLRWTAASGQGPQPCPASVPRRGSPCPEDQRCSYGATTTSSGAPLATEAVCSAAESTWEIWSPLGREVFPASAACDPRGRWQLSLVPEAQTLSGTCGSPSEQTSELSIRAAESGVLQLEHFGGQMTSDGCQLWLTDFELVRNVSEYNNNQLEIEIELEGTEAKGTYFYRTSGFCNSLYRGLVRATRVADEPTM